MTKNHIPPAEWSRFEMQRARREMIRELAEEYVIWDETRQFKDDFDKLAFALVDPDWHKPPKPHNIPDLPPFRTFELPRRLPYGPLRRMAERVGVAALRQLFRVGGHASAEFYRLELRPRLDKEFKRGNFYKRHEADFDMVRFGHTVLEIERECGEGLARGKALERAADLLGMAASQRTLERHFREFKEYCRGRGYVPHLHEDQGAPPIFALSDLEGRSTDKPEK